MTPPKMKYQTEAVRNGTAQQLTEAQVSALEAKKQEELRSTLRGEMARDLITAPTLLAMGLPPTKWTVPDILPEGLSILAGKPKLGKSWLAFGIAIAVAFGGIALGKYPVEVGDVLYLALEDTRRRLQDRLRRLCDAQQTPAPGRLTLATRWRRADDGGLDAIGLWLEDHPGARLVIVDTWARFAPRRLIRGNDYRQDSDDGASVQQVAAEHGADVLLLHHCRKMAADDPLDEVSGTLGLNGSADTVLVLRRSRGQADATLHVTGRDVDDQELALKWDQQYTTWTALGAAQDYRRSTEQQEVLHHLRKKGVAMTPAELAPALGKKRDTVKHLMSRMVDAGILRVAKGKYSIPPVPGVPSGQNCADDESGDEVKTPWDK
jgi:hypothetical protein